MSEYEYITFEQIPSAQTWFKFKPIFFDRNDNVLKNCDGDVIWINLNYCVCISKVHKSSIENSYSVTTTTETYSGRFVK